MSRFELRAYQQRILERSAAAEDRGVTRQLVVAATGLGKTVCFCEQAQRVGGRTLILVHRDELASQALAKIRQIWPGVSAGRVQAAENDVHAEVVVASVQTLQRPARLGQLTGAYDGSQLIGATEPFALVVVDEAHHATADSYQRILVGVGAIPCPCPETEYLAHMGCPTCGGLGVLHPAHHPPLLVGYTATPDRGDGRGLDGTFEEIVASYDILWGIRAGYLADIRGLAVKIDRLDLSKVKTTAGDYNAGQTGSLLEEAQAPRLIVKAWRKHAPERRTIAFTPTVAVAAQIVDEYRAEGVRADYVEAGTPRDDRRRILRDFATGEIQVVANCGVLTEGFDEPRADCILIARPTKSRGLYTQMVGRGTRRHPDKDHCLVIDIVGATEQHSLVTIPVLFGLDKTHVKAARDGTGGVADLVEHQEAEMVAAGILRAEEIELFDKVRGSGIAWIQVHRDGAELRRYQRGLGTDRETVVLAQRSPDDDSWTVGLQHPDGSKEALIVGVTLETAQGVGEDYIRRKGGGALADVNARWRKNKPSEKALAAAARWRLPIDPSWNAGQLSDALDARVARAQASKERKAREKAAAAAS